MARRSKPSDVRFLKRQVAELAAVNEALAGRLVRVCVDYEAELESSIARWENLKRALGEAEEARDEQARLKDYHKRRYDEAFALYSETKVRCDRYERERDEARNELTPLRWTLAGVEREREVARALAETMRAQAFPAPEFPWDRQTIETMGKFDPLTGSRRF